MHVRTCIQGYKVYQDPEGMRSLEQNSSSEASNRNPVANDSDDNYYKRRITSLNEEIKALNDEIMMVTIW